MSYPANVLAPNERLLLHRHPHWKTLISAVLLGLLATSLGAFVYWWVDRLDMDSLWHGIAVIVLGAAWVVVLAWFVVAPFVRWATTHFVITNQRVMFRTGVFNRTGIDIPLLRINTVQFDHDFIDRILRTGTLIIESASDDPLEFKDIPRVESVHSLLYSELHRALDDDPDGM